MSVPAYSAEELAARAADGSVDLTRLAATVAGILESTTAMANWVNAQIQTAADAEADADARRRKR